MKASGKWSRIVQVLHCTLQIEKYSYMSVCKILLFVNRMYIRISAVTLYVNKRMVRVNESKGHHLMIKKTSWSWFLPVIMHIKTATSFSGSGKFSVFKFITSVPPNRTIFRNIVNASNLYATIGFTDSSVNFIIFLSFSIQQEFILEAIVFSMLELIWKWMTLTGYFDRFIWIHPILVSLEVKGNPARCHLKLSQINLAVKLNLLWNIKAPKQATMFTAICQNFWIYKSEKFV